MKAETFIRNGWLLWWTHVSSLGGAVVASLAAWAMRMRHGPSRYFDPLELIVVPIAAETYLVLAGIAACLIYRSHHPGLNERFLYQSVGSLFVLLATLAALSLRLRPL